MVAPSSMTRERAAGASDSAQMRLQKDARDGVSDKSVAGQLNPKVVSSAPVINCALPCSRPSNSLTIVSRQPVFSSAPPKASAMIIREITHIIDISPPLVSNASICALPVSLTKPFIMASATSAKLAPCTDSATSAAATTPRKIPGIGGTFLVM